MIRTFRYMNLIFFLLMIAVNAIANIMPLGHGNTGSISSKYPNLYTPAPITFSIWGIIYLLVGFFIFYQFGFMNLKVAEGITELIGIWFIISCIMNIGWIFSWHYELIPLSMLFMVGLLFSLMMIALRLSPGDLEYATGLKEMPFMAKLCLYAFDIYLGWISAATIANMSVLLVEKSWNRFNRSEEFWTMIVLIVGTVLGMLFIISSQRYMSALAVIWAYCGILIKHISQDGYGGRYPAIITIAILGIVAILATGIIKKFIVMTEVS